MVDFVSVGCLGIDNIIGTNGEKRLGVFGGNAAYGAVGIALWHIGSVGIVSRKGSDFPHKWIRTLANHGIDIRGIHDVPMYHMMLAGMIYDSSGDRHEVTFNEESQSKELVAGFPVMSPEMVSRAHELFAPTGSDIPEQYLGADVAIAARHYDRQMDYIDRFRAARPDCLVVLDTGLQYMTPAYKDWLPKLFSRADVVIPSEAEARQLFGDISPIEMIRGMRSLGARQVILKLGRKGCLVEDGSHFIRVHAYHTNKAIDPSGAGDSFCGGVLVGLKKTGSLVEAAKYGTVSSSFIVENFGADSVLEVGPGQAAERLKNIICSTI